MSSFPQAVSRTLKKIGAERKAGRWVCPYCRTKIFRGDLVGEKYRYRCCCQPMQAELKTWGVYDLLSRSRRGVENLVQKTVPGVTARRVCSREVRVAGPLETDVVPKATVSRIIDRKHRHHDGPHNAILGVRCIEDTYVGEQQVRGVATLSTPTSRKLMEKGTHLEVNRICTWGPKWRRHNAVSQMSARLRKEARRLRREAQEALESEFENSRARKRAERRAGIGQLRTYILESESGRSLQAGDWYLVGRSEGGSWSNSRAGRQENPETEGAKWIYDTPL